MDLTGFADFGPFPGTTPELQEQLEAWCDLLFDPDAGAAGARARQHLIDAGRPAMPVIINALKKMDLTDKDKFRLADLAQYALGQICGGNSLGWKYASSEPDAFHLHNKMTIRRWIQLWERAENDDAFWARLIDPMSIEFAAE